MSRGVCEVVRQVKIEKMRRAKWLDYQVFSHKDYQLWSHLTAL